MALPAQVSLEATVVPAFEALSPEGSAKESRGTIDGSLDAEALFASGRGRASYLLDAGTFATPGDWSFLQHDADLTPAQVPRARRAVAGPLYRYDAHAAHAGY